MWHAEDPEEEVLAMVVRTGLHTCMGSMIRQILSPSFASAEKYPILWVSEITMIMTSSAYNVRLIATEQIMSEARRSSLTCTSPDATVLVCGPQ